MPLDPQFRAILDTLESSGLLPLIRGDAAQTRAHYRTLSLSRRGPGFVPERWPRWRTCDHRAACRCGSSSRCRPAASR